MKKLEANQGADLKVIAVTEIMSQIIALDVVVNLDKGLIEFFCYSNFLDIPYNLTKGPVNPSAYKIFPMYLDGAILTIF